MIPPDTLEGIWKKVAAAGRGGVSFYRSLHLTWPAKLVLAVLGIGLAVASLWPGTAGLVGKYDKIAHVLVYGVLALASLVLARDHPTRAKLVFLVAGLGAVVEILQNFKPDGEVSWEDFWANLAGIGLALVLWWGVRRIIRATICADEDEYIL